MFRCRRPRGQPWLQITAETGKRRTSMDRLVVDDDRRTADDHDERSVLERLVDLEALALGLRVGGLRLKQENAWGRRDVNLPCSPDDSADRVVSSPSKKPSAAKDCRAGW